MMKDSVIFTVFDCFKILQIYFVVVMFYLFPR